LGIPFQIIEKEKGLIFFHKKNERGEDIQKKKGWEIGKLNMLNNSTKNSDEIQGQLSIWLEKNKLTHRPLGFDYHGSKSLQIKHEDWLSIVVALYVYGFNYFCS
jgi:hypothetical protein